MSLVELTREGPVAHLRLNRPQALNAFSHAMFEAFDAAFEAYRQDDTLRAAVVSGEGRSFCGGLDLKEYAAERAAGHTRQETLHLIRFADPAWCDKPVVAAIQGHCVGVGMHLALACDFRVCSPDASFALPEVAIGMSLTRLSWQLARTVGMPAALELGLLAQPVDAAWAERNRLVHRCVPPERLLDEAYAIARRLAAVSAPALRVSRRTLYRAYDLEYQAMFEWSLPLRNAVLATGDDARGAGAFAGRGD